MAEYVDLRIEHLVPFFEELQRTKLFTEEEINKITEDFRLNEYKIEKKTRKLNDILDYIEYEEKLLKELKRRRKFQNFEHKQEIEDKLTARIHSQFGSAKITFSDDLQFWKAYMHFLRNMKSWSAISSLYQEMLRLHGSKYPHLYKNAADFEFNLNPCSGIDTARYCYQTGFRIHPKNLDLKIEAFSLELKYLDYLHKNRNVLDRALTQNNGEDIVTKLKMARLLYQDAVSKETQSEVFLRFFFATQPYEFAAKFQKEIMDDIKHRCEANETTFNYLAKLAIRNGDIPRAIHQYKIGIHLKPSEKMYDYFLETLWELILKTPNNFTKIALPIFEQAHQSQKLSVKGYILWGRVLNAQEDKNNSTVKDYRNVKKVLELGIKRFEAQSRKYTWSLVTEHIKIELKEGDFNVKKTIKNLSTVNNLEIPEAFWKHLFFAFVLRGVDQINVEHLVEMIENSDIKSKLRVLLLRHIGYNSSATHAKRYYEKFFGIPPLSFEFHKTMINIEQLQMSPNQTSSINFVKRCYQNAIFQFGSSLPGFSS